MQHCEGSAEDLLPDEMTDLELLLQAVEEQAHCSVPPLEASETLVQGPPEARLRRGLGRSRTQTILAWERHGWELNWS